MHGEGRFEWPDGRTYTGAYIMDKKEGYGEMRWDDGRAYKGAWVGGRQDGPGTYVNAEG